MLSSDISRFDVVAILGTSILIYCILGVVYRLYFHPLSRFPGPLLPAVTLWSEFYYECIQSGQYFLKIAQWHEKYGPIIRIGPNEIHVSDPEYYNTLFSYNAVRNKDPFYTAQFNTPDTEFGAEDHYVHRMRRSALNPFFSKASIDRLSPMLTSMVEKLSSRLEEFRNTNQPLNIRLPFQCYTADIVTLYATNRCWNHLDKIRTQIREILSGNILPVDIPIDGFPRTIFHNFLSSSLPDSEKKFSNMSQEAINIIGAGTDTTAHALMILMYYLAIDAVRYEKLREELRGVGFEMREDGGEDGGFKKLELGMVERLVYLNACALEGLRLSYGVSSRLARIAPKENLRYGKWEIPAGTPVGMSTMLQHHNEQIFPSSHQFIPERWILENGTINHALEKYLVTFSRGARSCIGQVLAKAEIHLALAVVVSRFRIQLYETDFERDVMVKRDYFLPQPGSDSRGVRVLLR
ncbi:similar to cytochrome P450 [Botrytis cinerea T4]|uniref:Similar to cytochrome P450 n=1 Tax=Botryotinia fuckeliana (strain T4) TaxID=999810 RepID=G2XSN4_BOTF4|nr:similar to cytochrome P450 [Botrytis cinerea T4]